MGTRSLTIVQDESGNEEIAVLYRQMDGYIEGHGLDLAKFLVGFEVVNGLGMRDNRKIANGMGCLFAQIIAHFKTEPGGFYLYPAGTRDCSEEYIYFVSLDEDKSLMIQCFDVYDEKTIFIGSPQELID